MVDPRLVPDRVLHVYPDYEPSPLLGVDRTRPLTGAELGLSTGLAGRVEAWQSLFEADHRGREGWRSDGAAAEYRGEGLAIVAALVTELPGFVLEYRLWPVGEHGYSGGWTRGWSPSGETPLPAGTTVREFDTAPERWIRLMNDYSGPPLWATYGGIGPEHLDLPEDLGHQLDAWQDEFDREYHWGSGWGSDAVAHAHAAEGRRLLPLIAADLPGHVIELKTGDEPVYAGAWIDGWLPVLPEVALTPWAE
ncbi:hypothetical protein [Tsukamurella pseudospumae]|uniref:Uncharacterized protein n=1 Tax=Tsukamurella pseudospumae TaxID=239498 RepID=A0A138AIV2_9ACTN|nr:hypothetical protein [Tsukamurella pseudospumae]KXP10416.1 hypothetical protein AXK60_08210 [Tsukamurella pseudospumae]